MANYKFNKETKTLIYKDTIIIDLTEKELQILMLLLSKPIVSFSEMAEKIYGYVDSKAYANVRELKLRLERKIGKSVIKTKSKIGSYLNEEIEII